MRGLIIKMSSMGDVIHTLPAVTDALNHEKNMTFDWVVEPGFADLPKMHPGVDTVIPLSIRQWRKSPLSRENRKQMRQAIKTIRQHKYDVIIDAQGLLKSAFVTKLAKGKKYGLARNSARESLASYFYHHKCEVSWHQHAVYRVRELFAKSLGYAIPSTEPDYHLSVTHQPAGLELSTPYLVFLHATTWETKHWPITYWKELLRIANAEGFQVILPWGNENEKLRAQSIAQGANDSLAKVLTHRLPLNDMASLLHHAQGAVAVDTGLGHLSAALSVPTVSLYGPTDPRRTGAIGNRQIHLTSNLTCAPCLSKSCRFDNKGPISPPCFERLPPLHVWQALMENMECVSTSQKSA